MKPRILLVGDFNRNDFLFIAQQLHKEACFYFIEHLNHKKITNRQCLEYGEVLYWKDFSDAFELLERIKPDRVVFYFIESYNHIALNVAAKVKKAPTFHLEHGLRFPLSHFKSITKTVQGSRTNSPHLGERIKQIFDVFDKFKNRRFFLNTVKCSNGKARSFLKEYFRVRSTHSILETSQKIQARWRLPDCYISYSPHIFNFHKELDLLPDHYPVKFIGVPGFDHFFGIRALKSTNENILFIDQPLHEQGLMGWSFEKKVHFLKDLATAVIASGKKLYIKQHPYNDKAIYQEIASITGVELLADQWEVVIKDVNTVLGFSSTLLLPLIAMEHICCFTMEVHPEPQALPYSYFLLQSGACHEIKSVDELISYLANRDYWHEKQNAYKEEFVKNWLYKFDGRSSERLKTILLQDEVV